MAGLLNGVQTFLKKLPVAGEPVIVAVSGGPDSFALLRALGLLRTLVPLGRIILAHLNHQLRGAESDGDEAFVHELSVQLAKEEPSAFSWHCQRVDVAEEATRHKESIETTARRVRYQWLTELAQEVGARWVATGHTADDQAETVLHRLLRGTGIKGLAGIPPRRTLAVGIEVIRPLLTVTRYEVLAFLAELKQPFRQDSSNSDPRFLRNRLRQELLPLLVQNYNPALVAVLGRLARQAGELQQQEEFHAQRLLEACERPRAGAVLVFDQPHLAGQPRLLVREMFRQVWAREQWPQQDMGFQEWDRLAAVALGDMPAADLPGSIRVRRRGKVVQVFPVSFLA